MDDKTRSYIIQCIDEDAEAALLHLEETAGLEHDTVYVDDISYEDSEDGIRATITYVYSWPTSSNPNDDIGYEIEVEYWVDGDNVEASASPEDIADELMSALKDDRIIEAATTIQASTPITAADGDEAAGPDEFNPDLGGEMFAEDADDGDIESQLDNISDDVADIQDSIDDVEEDDVQIQVDNNIENHYIAECDSCQGIFISSVVKSDQYLEKISGVCPLCNKETDQYLKWMVTAVE